jgi:hypothetical protein
MRSGVLLMLGESIGSSEGFELKDPRIGQEPPSEVRDDGVVHDTRTLYEVGSSAAWIKLAV